MQRSFFYSLLFLLTLCLIACGNKDSNRKDSEGLKKVIVEQEIEITQENLKNNKELLLQQIANELYLEAEKEIEAAPDVEMDTRGIYDDIKPVEVVIEPALSPSLDFVIEPEPELSEPEKTAKD